MTKTLIASLSALVLAIHASGCASLACPGPDIVNFTSTPSGAYVTIDGARVGRTPCTGTVHRSSNLVRFELPGHEADERGVPTTFNACFLGNLIFGGLLGMIIDIGSGNITRVQSEIHSDLAPIGASSRVPENAVRPPPAPTPPAPTPPAPTPPAPTPPAPETTDRTPPPPVREKPRTETDDRIVPPPLEFD